MSSNTIIVTGYPKSGNTWLSRLLADALDSPLTGDCGATPIGQEGLTRTGSYKVIQLHLVPDCSKDNGQFITNRFNVCPHNYDGEKIVVIARDPRDVAVSAYYYWKIKTLEDTITAMYRHEWPLTGTLAWHKFLDVWEAVDLPVSWIRYRDLVEDTLTSVQLLLDGFNLKPVNDLAEVISRQSLSNKRKFFEHEQDQGHHYHPYGTSIQLDNLRKGIVGDWRNHFTRNDAELLHSYFWPWMKKYGFETDANWYRNYQAVI